MGGTNGRAAFFDLDGVVIDSAFSLWRTTRDLLEENGVSFLDLPDFPSFLSVFSMPGLNYYRQYDVKTSLAELVQRFLEIIPAYEPFIQPYPGMASVISALRREGWVTAIISAGNPERVAVTLNKFGLGGLFDAVYSGEEDKAMSIKTCCERFDCVPRKTFFIGDMKSDMRDSRAAGVIPIGFAAGYDFMVSVLQAAGARICVYEPEDLLVVLPELLAES